jgi:hypothetical protein
MTGQVPFSDAASAALQKPRWETGGVFLLFTVPMKNFKL